MLDWGVSNATLEEVFIKAGAGGAGACLLPARRRECSILRLRVTDGRQPAPWTRCLVFSPS